MRATETASREASTLSEERGVAAKFLVHKLFSPGPDGDRDLSAVSRQHERSPHSVGRLRGRLIIRICTGNRRLRRRGPHVLRLGARKTVVSMVSGKDQKVNISLENLRPVRGAFFEKALDVASGLSTSKSFAVPPHFGSP
ncbi:uncharacterized protein LOC144098100 [Amblyomma americanum]